MTFYNTTGEVGERLKAFKGKTRAQDIRVMDFFIANPSALFTPCDVWANLHKKDVLTSVRRSITNLTSQGLLIKTKAKTEGIYGRPCSLWKLNPEVIQQKETQLELELELKGETK